MVFNTMNIFTHEMYCDDEYSRLKELLCLIPSPLYEIIMIPLIFFLYFMCVIYPLAYLLGGFSSNIYGISIMIVLIGITMPLLFSNDYYKDIIIRIFNFVSDLFY
jgi:hypothetical protein